MSQTAPYPRILCDLVDRLRYRAGWRFALADLDRGQGSAGLTLVITTLGTNSYHPEQTDYRVNHYMPVPPAAYDERSWRRWLFEQLLLVERHEAMEFFQVGDDRPYAPSHGFGQDPYIVRELGTDQDRRMSFRNELND
ncbi:MAG TPA: hypothetical protein VN088_15735 [Nocardioides sp.]|nr:hypothetical protein [Nocardioides sp.]